MFALFLLSNFGGNGSVNLKVFLKECLLFFKSLIISSPLSNLVEKDHDGG